MLDQAPLIPVILGPTAAGKTEVGIELARILDGEIISVDSRQVYKDIPVGTAQPKGTWEGKTYLCEGIPTHLVGFLSLNEYFTAGDFSKQAHQLIKDILARGKRPILLGGTGFYFKALQNGLSNLPDRDEPLRREMEDRIKKSGLADLYAELEKVDPQSATKISNSDKHKIIRALEIHHLTGQPLSSWWSKPREKSPFRFCVMGLSRPKEELENRIRERSLKMLNGMIHETEEALKAGFSPHCAGLSGFGYREAVMVLQGQLKSPDFLDALIKGTIAYAKRQRTWFRTQVRPHWFEAEPSLKKSDIALKMNDFLDSHR